MESIKATGMKGSFFVVCFLLFKGLRRMFSFLLFLWGIDKEERRQVWMEVETCGEPRKVVKSVLISYIHLLFPLV